MEKDSHWNVGWMFSWLDKSVHICMLITKSILVVGKNMRLCLYMHMHMPTVTRAWCTSKFETLLRNNLFRKLISLNSELNPGPQHLKRLAYQQCTYSPAKFEFYCLFFLPSLWWVFAITDLSLNLLPSWPWNLDWWLSQSLSWDQFINLYYICNFIWLQLKHL